jgi:septal ring factor EnvC (AmiA/AmiB activator)
MDSINISLTLLISFASILVTIVTTFVVVKKQTESNTKQLERIEKKVENHEKSITTHDQEIIGLYHNIKTLNTKQTEQDKSYLEIKTTLAGIAKDILYIKENIEDLKEERKA